MDALAARVAVPLWDEAALRAAEGHAASHLAPHSLMARAGGAAARLLRARWPHARSVLVLAGPGNNGGDGLAAAAWLARLQWAPRLQVLLVGCGDSAQWSPGHRPPDWCWALAQARAAGIEPRPWSSIDAAELLRDADVVLDALLGLGLHDAPRGEIAQAIESVGTARRRCGVVAVDLPSGLSGATGQAAGGVVRADATLAMLGLQPGHVTGPDSEACGELWLDELQVDPRTADARPLALWGDVDSALQALPALPQAAHKGARGDVRLFGGAAGMDGALWLAARAALTLGAGRVFAAALDPRAPSLDPVYPEIMLRDVRDLLGQARDAGGSRNCLVFGPGAGTSPEAAQALLELLALEQALVIDADGLNLLAAQAPDGQAWSALRARRAPTWLTPHPTEAARLLRSDTAAVQADRLGAARRLADLARAHVVLKGAGSVLADPDGSMWVNSSGNGLLASAGTGDVLSGALAACLALGCGSVQVARAAVWLHGATADQALRDGGALRAGTLPDSMLRAWQAQQALR